MKSIYFETLIILSSTTNIWIIIGPQKTLIVIEFQSKYEFQGKDTQQKVIKFGQIWRT